MAEKFLAKIFSGSTLRELADYGCSPKAGKVLSRSHLSSLLRTNISLGEIYDEAYKYLLDTYRCEYIYKNILVNKLLLGKHSLNTAIVLSEFRSGKTKADLVLLNGTSNVYEIKTEFDSLDRLQKQLLQYKYFFEFINVVTHETHANEVFNIADQRVGIIIITPQQRLKTIRKPESNLESINSGCLFRSLRKNEYTELVESEAGYIPEVPNTEIYARCKNIVEKIPPHLIHNRIVSLLKSRCSAFKLGKLISSFPVSLRMGVIALGLREGKLKNLQHVFTQRCARPLSIK